MKKLRLKDKMGVKWLKAEHMAKKLNLKNKLSKEDMDILGFVITHMLIQATPEEVKKEFTFPVVIEIMLMLDINPYSVTDFESASRGKYFGFDEPVEVSKAIQMSW